MNKLISLFTLLVFTTSAFAGTNSVNTAQVSPYSSASRNYVKNPSARLNSSYVTTSSAAIARVTTAGNKLDGFGSFTCDASANGGYCEFTLDTIETPDDTGDCEFSGQINGDGSLYSAQILDGSANVLNSTTLGNVSTWTGFGPIVYPCGSSRKVRITQTTAGTAPALGVGRLYYGKVTGTGNVAQAQFVGSVKWSPTTSCMWTTTSASFANFSNDTDCDDNSRTVTGNVTDVSSGLRPAVSIPNAGPGRYVLKVIGDLYKASSTNVRCDYQVTDGTNSFGIVTVTGSTSEVAVPIAEFERSYSTTGTLTLDVQAKASSGNSCAIDVTNQNLEIAVYRYPSTSETAYRPNLQGGSWSGYHDSTCSWSVTSTSYADFTADATCALAERQNSNFGTVSSSGSVLPAITFTPKKAGRYYVCSAPQVATGATDFSSYRITDGTTVVAEGGIYGSSNTRIPICGIYNAASTASVTLKLQGKDNTGSANINSGGQNSAIEWSVVSIDQSFPAPVLVGSVTSGSSGAERIERARLNGSTITSQSGSWISYSSTAGTGDFTYAIASGIFSGTPTCVCSSEVGGFGEVCTIGSVSATSVRTLTGSPSTGNNRATDIICMGPR